MKISGPLFSFLVCSMSAFLQLLTLIFYSLKPMVPLEILIIPFQGLIFGLAFTYSNPRIFEGGNQQKWFYAAVFGISFFVSLTGVALLKIIYFIAFRDSSELVTSFFPGLCLSIAITLVFSLKMRSELKMKMIFFGTLLGSLLHFVPDLLNNLFFPENSGSEISIIVSLVFKIIWFGAMGAFLSYYGEKELGEKVKGELRN